MPEGSFLPRYGNPTCDSCDGCKRQFCTLEDAVSVSLWEKYPCIGGLVSVLVKVSILGSFGLLILSAQYAAASNIFVPSPVEDLFDFRPACTITDIDYAFVNTTAGGCADRYTYTYSFSTADNSFSANQIELIPRLPATLCSDPGINVGPTNGTFSSTGNTECYVLKQELTALRDYVTCPLTGDQPCVSLLFPQKRAGYEQLALWNVGWVLPIVYVPVALGILVYCCDDRSREVSSSLKT